MRSHIRSLMALTVATGLAACAPSSHESRVAGPAGSLRVDDGGKARDALPVVFLHAFGGDVTQWAPQLEHLRKTRRAIAFDLRAHGESEAPRDGQHSIEAMTDDVQAVVDKLGVDRFVLVGHSMGGDVALAYAAKHPERVAGLVLVGTPGKIPAEMSQQILATLRGPQRQQVLAEHWGRMTKRAHPQSLTKIEEGRARLSDDRSVSFIEATFAFDPAPALAAYDGPMLAVTTDADGDDQPGALHHLAPIPHKVVSGTSHWIQLDDPQAMNRILDEFLASLSGA
jgi:pimeloyl-ACP methyl ester carboxylesterase